MTRARGFFKYALVLGLIAAIGPFAVDMYLPALPSIKATFAVDTGTAQLSLVAFFAALAIFQLVYGPLSDMVGRRPPLYAGLALFLLGSVGCALAPNIAALIAFRFVQGVGGCAGMVITLAIVRDLYSGADAVRLLSLLMLVFSISPILSPVVGSLVVAHASWRVIFWAVIGAALVALALLTLFLPEPRPPAARVDSSMRGALAAYRKLLGDPSFLGLVFIGSFGMAAFFCYLGNSSFILIEHYGLSPTEYSLCFSVNAVAFFSAAQGNGRLAERYGMRRVVRAGTAGFAAAMAALAVLTLAGVDQLPVMVAFLFAGFGCLGLVIPNAAVLALDPHADISGTASALMGTLQFVTGSAIMAISGALGDGTARPMVLAIAGCALTAFALARITLKNQYDRGLVTATS